MNQPPTSIPQPVGVAAPVLKAADGCQGQGGDLALQKFRVVCLGEYDATPRYLPWVQPSQPQWLAWWQHLSEDLKGQCGAQGLFVVVS